MLKIRQVNEQQINAALQAVQNEQDKIDNKMNDMSKKFSKSLLELDDAVGDNLGYLNDNFVPNTRKINGHELTDDITLTASDVGAATTGDIGNAIGALDVSSVGGSGKYISEISESNGLIIGTASNLSDASVGSAGKLTTARTTYVTLGTASTTTTRDWSGDTTIPVNGTLAVANGGTGQTSQLATNKAIIAEMTEGTSDVTDGTMFVSSYASDNGFSETDSGGPNKPYKRKFSAVWNYIKSKISSILGLTATSYGGNSATATTSNWVKGATLRPTTSNLYPKSTNGSLTHFLATSSMTTQKPATDGHILQMSWDNNGGYGAQFYLPNSAPATYSPMWRAESGGTWSNWRKFITEDNILNTLYPIGAIYLTISSSDFSNFLGGTWKKVTDGRFIRASGTNAGSVPTIAQINAGSGGTQAEGLPNITGNIQSTDYSIGSNTGISNSGALKGELFNKKTSSGTSQSASYMSKISFNASDGNSTVPQGASSGKIYGNSNHVTPYNMAVYMWVRTA